MYFRIILFLQTVVIVGSGYWIPLWGPRDTARGGAFMAQADDLTAVQHNPANMASFRGLQTYISLGMINTASTINYYNRPFSTYSNVEDPTRYDYKVTNTAKTFFNPNLVISNDFGLKKWNFSFAVYGPYAPNYDYDQNCSGSKAPLCANRYSLYNSSMVLVNGQFGIAYQPIKELSIGIGLKLTYVNFQYNLDLVGSGGALGSLIDEEAKNGGADINIDFDATDPINFNFNFGITYKPTRWLTLAATYQSPIDIDATGDAKATIYDTSTLLVAADTVIKGDKLDIHLKLPHQFGFGILFTYQDLFNIEVDLNYELWSRHDQVRILPRMTAELSIGDEPIQMTEIIQEKQWKDTFTLQVGGDLNFLKKSLVASLGFFFEQGAVPTETLDASVIDSDKYGFTGGGTWRTMLWGRAVEFYASVAYIYFKQRDVTNSEVYVINPIQMNYPDDFIVGNGRYKQDMLLFAMGSKISF